jgi:7-keto-8-aminopelargonate synthetase-like enzyme
MSSGSPAMGPSVAPGSPEAGMLRIRCSPMSGVVVARQQGRDLVLEDGSPRVDFATGAYLGLEADVGEGDLALAREFGLRDGWSMATGHSALTRSFQAQLAAALGMDGIVLSTSAALINHSVFGSLRPAFRSVLYDEDVHVTCKSGVVAAYPTGTRWGFRHGDLDQLAALLAAHPGPALVVVDGLYSMRGVEAPVAAMVALCARYDATLYVDDVHGFGVCGRDGYGVIERLNLEQRQKVILVGSFAKAASNPVAFLAFPEALRWLVASMPALNYSGPPSNLHVAVCARHLQAFPAYADRRARVASFSRRLHATCEALGLETLSVAGSPLLLVALRDEGMEEATALLADAGLLCKVAIFPVVRRGEEALRFSITASHTEEHVVRLEAALRRLSATDAVR